MAAGKVVVGSNAGGMNDLIENEKSGFLVNPEDEYSQIKTLEKIIADNELRVTISTNARNSINNKSMIRIQQSNCLKFYNSIISSN